ncbi:MAG: HPr family phosphocarrier protein [Planctomycetota bacterium]|jgi:phosphocarrier protein|nr:HPr family phosphocarrier protein [Planctomycetota bacterium]
MDISFKVTLKNRYGLHVRPATTIAATASQFKSAITVANSRGEQADARYPMELLVLAAMRGEELTITVGDGDTAAASALRELFDSSFGGIE